MTQTSRYTVTTWWHSGHPRGDAVRDALRACLSEWDVAADVHVTRQPAATGDDAHTVTVHWDTTAPEWPDEYWPMHAADALGHAAERVDGVTDAVVVCHDRPVPVVLEVDTTPPRPPYELNRPGNRPESHAEARLAADPYSTTHGGTQAAQDALSLAALAARVVAAAVIVGLLCAALAAVVDQATATWPPAARAATTGALVVAAAALGLTTGWAVIRKGRRH